MSDILVEVAEAVPVEVNLPAKDNAIEMEVYYQDEVSLDTDLSLFYIKSGEKEIENYVEGVAKPEINDYIETYAKPIVSEVVDNIATPIIDEYFEETVKPNISRFAAEEMSSYAEVATTQAGIATAAAAEASTTAQTVDTKVAEFDTYVGEKTEEFEQTAQQATADSQANVEKSRIWAEGEQAEVKPLGGELSSMGAADLAYALANAPEDTPIDASGLFAMNVVKGEKGDKGDKGDKGTDGKDGVDGKDGLDTFATNCITEIPQDIKLELVDGRLVLKSGSKIRIPNGKNSDDSLKFDEFIIETDISCTFDNANQKMVFFHPEKTTLWHCSASFQQFSGDTQPTTSWGYWYDTKNNIIKHTNNGSNWTTGFSLPLCIATGNDNGVPTSIDQVFNGFGYIGSTVFVLPNVKGLIPNGRNADGSLKNIEFVTSKVITHTYGSETYGTFDLTLKNDNTIVWYSNLLVKSDNYLYNGNTYLGADKLVIGKFNINSSSDNGKISFLSTKLPFRAVDYNGASGLGMPSDKYIDLTLGASGTKYTAPANGWFMFRRDTTSGYVGMEIVGKIFNVTQNNTGTSAATSIFCPAQKGDTCKIVYTGSASGTPTLKFIYAEGEN